MADRVYEELRSARPLAAALEYAGRGWPVLPVHEPDLSKASRCSCGNRHCKSPGKHPRIKGWREEATTDRGQIEAWWTKWPEASVGIATGDGLLVVDVDPRNGGSDTLAELDEEFGRIETFRVRTGSGGEHLYLKIDRPVPNRTNWRPGIDLKGDGGYVVAPPSLHSCGDAYAVADGQSVARAPGWLLRAIGSVPDAGTSVVISPEHLRSLAAPGDTPAERVRWTREAVDSIPNDADFDDRTAWIGMAYAIKTSCGADAELEAYEIFDEFSSRWEQGGYDPDATKRAWDTLGSPRATTGFSKLLTLARSNGYELPHDHPCHAQNEFDSLAAEVGHLAESANEKWDWESLPDVLREARERLRGMGATERIIFESLILSKLFHLTRSFPVAQSLWRSLDQSAGEPLAVVDGKPVLRLADPTDLELAQGYLVEGLVPAAQVGELIADTQMGKTWLLLHLALCIAFGVPFFGKLSREGVVLYLAYEGQDGLWKRIAGWLHARGHLEEGFSRAELRATIDGRFLVADLPPRFDFAGMEELLRDSIAAYGAVMVVIDTRGKSLGLAHPEDSADTANFVQGMLSRVAHETGSTIISSHHTGLADKTRGRGSSAWTQGTDFAWVIEGSAEAFGLGEPMTLHPKKNRDDERPPPMRFRLNGPIELTVDGLQWRSAAIDELASKEPAVPTDGARVFQAIETNAGCGLEALRKSVVGIGSGKIDRALAELLAIGAIEDRGTSRRRRYHALPGWRVQNDGEVRHPGEDFEDLDQFDAVADDDPPSPGGSARDVVDGEPQVSGV